MIAFSFAMSFLTVLSAAPLAQNVPVGGGERWAVVIGVENYYDVALPSAQGSDIDARAIRNWLVNTARWKDENVRLLNVNTRNSPAAAPGAPLVPNAQNIRSTFEEIRGKMNPGDMLFIYFAGHAASLPTPKDRPVGLVEEPDYIIPIDIPLSRLREGGINLSREIDRFSAAGVFQVVCWLDTTPRGRVTRKERFLEGTEAGDRMLRGLSRGNGVTAWIAGSGEEPMRIDQNAVTAFGQSVMTQRILKYLGAKPEQANDLAFVLTALRGDAYLRKQGFGHKGNMGPGLTLWPYQGQATIPFDEPLIQRGHSKEVLDIEFSSDGSRIYSASQDSTVRVWRVEDGTLQGVINHPNALNGFHKVVIGPAGQIGLLDGKGRVDFYDETKKSFADQAGFDQASIFSGLRADELGFLPMPDVGENPELRALSVNNGSLRRWRVLPKISEQKTEFLPISDVRIVAIAPSDGMFGFAVVKSTDFSRVEFFDREKSDPVDTASFEKSRIHAISMSAGSDDRQLVDLVMANAEGSTKLVRYRPTDKSIIWELPLGQHEIKDARISRGGGKVLLGIRSIRKFGQISSDSIFILPDTDDKKLVVKAEKIALNEKKSLAELEVAISSRGDRLAAIISPGRELKLWDVEEDDGFIRAKERSHTQAGAWVDVTSMKFAPDDSSLILGFGNGAMKITRPNARAEDIDVPAAIGRPRFVKMAPGRDALLQVNEDGRAVIWKMKPPYGIQRILGRYEPLAAHLPSGDLIMVQNRVVTTDRNEDVRLLDDDESSLVMIDGKRHNFVKRLPNPPNLQGGLPHVINNIRQLSVSKDGKILAVAGNNSTVYFWSVPDAVYLGTMSFEGDVNALEFAHQGNRLIVCESSEITNENQVDRIETIRLFEVKNAENAARFRFEKLGEWKVKEDGNNRYDIIRARFSPVDPDLVLLVRDDGGFGKLRLSMNNPENAVEWPDTWWISDADRGLDAYDGLVSTDGNWYIGGGDHKRLWIVPNDGNDERFRANRRKAPRKLDHDERIRSIDSWKIVNDDGEIESDVCMLASASDDGTVKLWKLSKEDASLELVCSLHADRDQTEWIAFSPNARFDASTTMADRVTWSPKSSAIDSLPAGTANSYRRLLVSQFESSLIDPEIMKKVVAGRIPDNPRPMGKTPPLVHLKTLDYDLDHEKRIVKFRVGVSPPLKQGKDKLIQDKLIQVYHNDSLLPLHKLSPVGNANQNLMSEFELEARLVHGVNRFFAVVDGEAYIDNDAAGDLEGFPRADGRSDNFVLNFDGPTKGKVHLLAIGIGDYAQDSKLSFAVEDAKAFLNYLDRKAPAQDTVVRKLLLDQQVDENSIETSLEQLRNGNINPEDTVIVFYSGHARVQDDKFQFLLPGAAPDDPGIQPSYPLSMIYRLLSAVGSLNRLVIIDSCQTERIGNDPSLIRARKLIRDPEERSRIHFILASRDASITGESNSLRHGLLTYSLLHGLEDQGIAIPPEVSALTRSQKNRQSEKMTFLRADLDRNNDITSDELDAYAWSIIPELLSKSPHIVQRGPKLLDNPGDQVVESYPDIFQDPGKILILEGP